MRAVFEVMGVTDIIAKSIGSTNLITSFVTSGLMATNAPSVIAAKRARPSEDSGVNHVR